MQLILASGSVYRKELLSRLGLPFRSVTTDVDESRLPGETAQALVRRLAFAKARAVLTNYPQALVIGSDQTAALDEILLNKLVTAERACEQLLACSGREVVFYTGLTLLTQRQSSYREITTQVCFRRLSEQQIAHYVAREQPLDCAGSFKYEGLGIALFEKIISDDPTNLIGLPLIALTDMLQEFGLMPFGN